MMNDQVLYVQHVLLQNDAGFVMSFAVRRADGQLAQETERYPVLQTRVQDLSQLRFGPDQQHLQVEEEVCPVVYAVAGVTREGPAVRYAPNGQTAAYIVRGATLMYDIVLRR